LQVNRWAAMETGLREVGYREPEIAEMMGELMGAFKESDETGQAHWVTLRKKILRRRADADAFEKAERAEAKAVKMLPGVRNSKHVKRWAEQRYGTGDTKPRARTDEGAWGQPAPAAPRLAEEAAGAPPSGPHEGMCARPEPKPEADRERS